MNIHLSPKDLGAVPNSVTTGPIFGSRKVYAAPASHPALRVPFREIALTTASEPPVRVYDPSGPYTDTDARIDLSGGLAPVRENWIAARGFGTIEGRAVRAEDNGNVAPDRLVAPCPATRVLRVGAVGTLTTQLEFARAGIITEEMAYVAHRENLGCAPREFGARERG